MRARRAWCRTRSSRWPRCIQYWRLHPQRTGTGGAITGFTTTHFVIDGAKEISYPAIQEFVDGNGVKRLAIYGTSGNFNLSG